MGHSATVTSPIVGSSGVAALPDNPEPIIELSETVTKSVTVGESPAALESEMPLPSDPKTIFLGGLFLLAMLTACYLAGPIIAPLVMAFFLKLLLQPLYRWFTRLHIPKPLSALMAMLALAMLLIGLGLALSMPTPSWQAISDGFPRLEQKLKALQAPIGALQGMLTKAQQATSGAKNAATVAVERIGLVDLLFSGTRAALEGLVTTTIVLFFLMLSGDTFLRRGVEIMPNFENKRRAVEISQQVEQDITAYLLTVVGMNAIVGVAVGIAMWCCGIGDPILWGAAAFLLNFVPILGPLCGIGVFLLAGLLRFEDLLPAVMPAAIYLAIHIVEGEVVTPMLLARRFTMNPVAVILSLFFWYWMWGVPGAVLAVPMLAITKIICDHVRPLKAIGHLLEGEETSADRYLAKKRSRTRS
ncbi:MAG TPA: AI-2E family transporter [Dongiaceae bacterium]